jgi:hypothetical protein
MQSFRLSRAFHTRITAFAQSDPDPENPTCLGLPVLGPEQLKSKNDGAIVAICSAPGLQPITDTLKRLGFEEWKDFFFYAYLL